MVAAVDGVDCLWVGHMDLSCSLGIPAAFHEARFQEAQQSVADAARRHGKSAGRMVRNAEEGEALYRAGFDVIACANDVNTYQTALTAAVADLRARVAEAR